LEDHISPFSLAQERRWALQLERHGSFIDCDDVDARAILDLLIAGTSRNGSGRLVDIDLIV
jgi:hypothetical protein